MVLASAAQAFAHGRLESASPAPGELLQAGTSRVRLNFSEPVKPVPLRIVDGSGRDLASGQPPRAVDAGVVLDLPAALPAGGYIVSYRVLSADAHPVAASFGFQVGNAGEAGGPATADASSVVKDPATPWGTWLVVARAAYMLGLLLTSGSGLFLLLVPSAGLQLPMTRAIKVHAALTLVTSLAYLQLGGADMVGSEGLPDAAALRVAAGSSLGVSIGVAAVGLLLLIVTASRDRGWLLLGTALLISSRALTGHPVSRDPAWLLMPVMTLHVACAAFWYAALPPLYLALGRLPLATAATLTLGFSRVAMVAVAALLTAGVVMAVVHLAIPSALLGTWYGQLLVMKSTWFAVLLLLAAWHKQWLTPRLLAGDAGAARRLRASIVVEGVIMTLVVLISVNVAGTAPEAPTRTAAPPAIPGGPRGQPITEPAEVASADGAYRMKLAPDNLTGASD